MTTMTDKAAKEIAEKTVKKFDDAGREVCFILKDKKTCNIFNTMETADLADVAMELLFELAGDNAEAVFKDAVKQAKELKKKEKKDAKRKNRA